MNDSVFDAPRGKEGRLLPFLKWAGGKRWLLNSGLPQPKSFNRYIEPFLGGGAVFFGLQPPRAVLSDINSDLVLLYEVMRGDPVGLYEAMTEHQRHHGTDYYYQLRAENPDTPLKRAARMLYLNRTCWNGLYRVNRRGEFNVPIGSKSTVIMPDDDFQAASRALSKASLRCCDFEETISAAQSGDFVFVDPPYTVKHNMNGFVKYNESIFTWLDQIRLRDTVSRAIARGASVVITNADHPSVRELYHGLATYQSMPRSSVLAGPADRRGRTSEALFHANVM